MYTYTCQCEGSQMGPSPGVLIKEATFNESFIVLSMAVQCHVHCFNVDKVNIM